jgi:hypothetical protein
VVEHLSSMFKTLGLIPSTEKKKREREGERALSPQADVSSFSFLKCNSIYFTLL